MKEVRVKVESDELQKIIKELITDEEKSQARSIAQKAFNEELELRMQKLVDTLDKDMNDNYWSSSGIRKMLIEELKGMIANKFKDETIHSFIQQQVEAELRGLRDYYTRILMQQLQKDVEVEVKKQFKEIFEKELAKKLFDTEDKNER